MKPFYFKVWQNWSGPRQRRHRPKYTILVVALLLVAIGALVQFTISPSKVFSSGAGAEANPNLFFFRHLLAVFVGLIALIAGLNVHLRHWLRFSPWILAASLAVAALIGLISGERWLYLAGNSLQPVEIVKFSLVLVLAGLAWKIKNGPKLKTIRETLWAHRFFLALLALTTLVVGFWQSDLGSLVVIIAAAGAILVLAGIGWPTLTALLLAGLAGLIGLIVVAPYRIQRLVTFFGEAGNDCLEFGYHICQALIAIGSGGLTGRGFGRSTSNYGYLPETLNDSIFALYAQITGFLGAVVLLGLFFWLFWTIYKQIFRLEDSLALIASGLLAWLASQTVINIGSMLDLLPMKGITLPFISFGGSSLVMVLLAIGLLLQISSYSRYSDYESRQPSWWSRWWRWWSRYNQKRRQARG